MPSTSVMKEFQQGALRSGSPTGPKVTNPKQAIAIKYSEQAKEGKGMLHKKTHGKKRGAK